MLDKLFEEVLVNTEVFFQNSKENCILLNFYKDIETKINNYSEEEVFGLLMKIIQQEGSICFLSDTDFWDYTNEAKQIASTANYMDVYHFTSILQLIYVELETFSYLKNLVIKDTNTSGDILSDTILIERLIYYKSTLQEYLSIQKYLDNTNPTDIILLDLKSNLDLLEFKDYLSVTLKKFAYRYLINKFSLYFKQIELIHNSYSLIGTWISKPLLIEAITSCYSLQTEYKLDIKGILSHLKIIPYYNGLFKALIIYQKPLSTEEEGVVENSYTISSDVLFNELDPLVLVSSFADFSKEYIISRNQTLKLLTESIDSNIMFCSMLMEEQKLITSTVDFPQANTELEDLIDKINTEGLTEENEKDLASTLEDINNQTETKKSENNAVGSSLAYVGDEKTQIQSNTTYLTNANSQISDTTDLYGTTVENSLDGVNDLIRNLEILNNEIPDWLQGSTIVDITSLVSLVQKTLSELNDLLCESRSLLCFVSTLQTNLELTQAEIAKGLPELWEAVQNISVNFTKQFDILTDNFITNVNTELCNQTKEVVNPKINSIPETNLDYSLEIQKALQDAIKNTCESSSASVEGLLTGYVSEAKVEKTDIAKQAYSDVEQMFDLDTCKTSPLFKFPSLLNKEFSLDLSMDLVSDFDFKLRNCR